jgi:hypothetical protein
MILDAQYLQIILELSEARQGSSNSSKNAAVTAPCDRHHGAFGPTEKRSQPWRIHCSWGGSNEESLGRHVIDVCVL